MRNQTKKNLWLLGGETQIALLALGEPWLVSDHMHQLMAHALIAEALAPKDDPLVESIIEMLIMIQDRGIPYQVSEDEKLALRVMVTESLRRVSLSDNRHYTRAVQSVLIRL